MSRIEHLQNLNSININSNIEIVDKICAYLFGELVRNFHYLNDNLFNQAYFNACGEVLNHLENQIDEYITGIRQKMIYYKDMVLSLQGSRENIEKIYSIQNVSHIAPNTTVIIFIVIC